MHACSRDPLVVGVCIRGLLVGQLVLSQDCLPRGEAAIWEEGCHDGVVYLVPRPAQQP